LKTISLLVVFLLLAGCGGRAAHPVAVNNAYDDRLTCDHLHAERGVNDSKLADLTKERKDANGNNVGTALLEGPLWLDLSGAERTEADALVKRNAVLDGLIAKRCGAGAANAG
jgi:hypothetical protein